MLLLISLFVVLFIFTILFHVLLYQWTIELEKNGCECSKLWHYDFIKYGSLSLLIITILNSIRIFYNLSLSKNIQDFNKLNQQHYIIRFIIGIIGIIGISYMAILLDYIIKLKEMQDCKCSEDWKREFGYYYSIVFFALLLFGILLNIIAGIILVYTVTSSLSKK
jgi:hypothetical protein